MRNDYHEIEIITWNYLSEDNFPYLGSSVSSTERDIDMRLTKAWTAININSSLIDILLKLIVRRKEIEKGNKYQRTFLLFREFLSWIVKTSTVFKRGRGEEGENLIEYK